MATYLCLQINSCEQKLPVSSQAEGYLLNRDMWLPSLSQSCKPFSEGRVFAEILTSKHCVFGVVAGLFQSLQLLIIHTFLLVCPSFFSMANLTDCNAALVLFYYYYFCIYCLLKFESHFVIGLRKKVESLIKQTIKPFLVDWFTNLNGNGERSAAEVFLHHVADPLRRTK